MSDKRMITDETMDALVEWIFCHWPCALEDKEFIRGVFFLTDEAIRDAVAYERWRMFAHRRPSVN